jgi:hypothetical protein
MDGDINDMLVKPEEQEEYEEEDLGPSHRDIFAKDLPNLMYGFGDSSKPLKESVALLEDMAVEYITGEGWGGGGEGGGCWVVGFAAQVRTS